MICCLSKNNYVNGVARVDKAYVIDKQNFDKARLTKILGYGDAVSLIIVVWEKTFADMKFEVSTLLKRFIISLKIITHLKRK